MTFSEMSIPLLESTVEAYQLLFEKHQNDILHIASSGSEVPRSMYEKYNLIVAATNAAKLALHNSKA